MKVNVMVRIMADPRTRTVLRSSGRRRYAPRHSFGAPLKSSQIFGSNGSNISDAEIMNVVVTFLKHSVSTV